MYTCSVYSACIDAGNKFAYMYIYIYIELFTHFPGYLEGPKMDAYGGSDCRGLKPAQFFPTISDAFLWEPARHLETLISSYTGCT